MFSIPVDLCNQKADKWSRKAVLWDPELDTKGYAKRKQQRPKTRWEDDIISHVKANLGNEHWMQYAKDKEIWRSLEKSYINQTNKHGLVT